MQNVIRAPIGRRTSIQYEIELSLKAFQLNNIKYYCYDLDKHNIKPSQIDNTKYYCYGIDKHHTLF